MRVSPSTLQLCYLIILIFFFSEKYEFVGRLLRPGEQPTSYSDEEDESNASSSEKPKDEETAGKSKDD